MELFPDVIDPLKHGEVGEDSQNPQDGLHPIEKSADDEKNDSLCSFHDPDVARDLQCLRLRPNIRDQDGAHADKRSEDDDIRFSPFQVVCKDGKKKKEVRISVQNRIQEAPQGRHLP